MKKVVIITSILIWLLCISCATNQKAKGVYSNTQTEYQQYLLEKYSKPKSEWNKTIPTPQDTTNVNK